MPRTNPRIKIFSTGGTIDKIYFDAKSEYEVGEPQALEIMSRALVQFDYEAIKLLRKDSLDINDADRDLICNAIGECDCEYVVITHGTDTMVETANALEAIEGKTIVLTGSLSPAQFRSTDAEFNLGVAIGAVQSLDHGVYISMNGIVFESGKVIKNRAENRFEYL